MVPFRSCHAQSAPLIWRCEGAGRPACIGEAGIAFKQIGSVEGGALTTSSIKNLHQDSCLGFAQ